MKNDFVILALLCLSLIVTFIIGYREGERRSEGLETSDTLIVRDTITNTILKDTAIVKYIPKKVEVIKYDTIKENTVLTYEKKLYVDTVVFDNDSIITANAVVGVDARLDSTHIIFKRQNKVITNTIYINNTVEKKKTFWNRFHIQPQVTSGFDIINHQWGICGGIGVGFDL